MKSILKISLLANVLLAGAALWLASRPRIMSVQPPVPGLNPIPAAAPAHPQAQNPDNVVQAPFRWREIESSDYRAYIANLRAIGCPERTIREIIVADVDDLYDERRQEMRGKLAADAPAALDSSLQKLRNEEIGVIQALLGLSAASTQQVAAAPVPVADQAAAVPKRKRRANRENPVVMPLAFEPVDLGQFNLTDQQLQLIDELRQEFQMEIGTNQDPSDPEYAKRWQTAQIAADQMMKDLLGPYQFDYQMQVADIRSRQQTSPGQ